MCCATDCVIYDDCRNHCKQYVHGQEDPEYKERELDFIEEYGYEDGPAYPKYRDPNTSKSIHEYGILRGILRNGLTIARKERHQWRARPDPSPLPVDFQGLDPGQHDD